MRTALITGVTGQDGSFLNDFLLEKDYKVLGLHRRSSINKFDRISHQLQNPNLELIEGDVSDPISISGVIEKYQPDECYSCAAQSVTADSLLPIKIGGYIHHRTLEELWNNQISRNKKPKIDNNGVEVIDLPLGTHNTPYALGYWNGMGTWFNIRQISRHKWNGKIAKMSQKFGEIMVTPNHCIYDAQQQLCKPEDNPWLLAMRKLNYTSTKTNTTIKLNILYRKFEEDDTYF